MTVINSHHFLINGDKTYPESLNSLDEIWEFMKLFVVKETENGK